VPRKKKPTPHRSGLKPGDTVVMHSCYEAPKHEGRIWTVRSEPWDLCGTEVVLLEGYSGGFSTEKLARASV